MTNLSLSHLDSSRSFLQARFCRAIGTALLVWAVTTPSIGFAAPKDRFPPTVSITSPGAGTSYTVAQTISINASASDNVGVSRVEFYDNGLLHSTDIAPPYSAAWAISSSTNGSHQWTARAYDFRGNMAESNVVALTVNIAGGGTNDTQSPSVSISTPGSGTSYSSAQTVMVSASASDNVGVSRVEFYDNGVLRATDYTSPYSAAWSFTSADNGSHVWMAKAFDAAGNIATSAAVTLNVNIAAADTVAPSISITSPANGATYTTDQSVSINVVATDNIGISRVEFYDGATRVQSPDDLKAYDPTLYAILEKVYAGHHIPADVYYGKNLKPQKPR